MSIEEFLNRDILIDTAVYWGNPTLQASGYFSYDSPVEISCRWVEKKEAFIDNEGKEAVSRAVVYVGQDLDDHGMLFHGTLDDLTAAEESDPRKVSNAHEIKTFMKIPELDMTDKFVRKAML